MKVSGAVKALVKRLERGDIRTSKNVSLKEQHPQIYDRALEIFQKRKAKKLLKSSELTDAMKQAAREALV